MAGSTARSSAGAARRRLPDGVNAGPHSGLHLSHRRRRRSESRRGAADTVAVEKAKELGDLRFSQRATVHQLVREYRLLAEVLSAFVTDRLEAFNTLVAASDVLTVATRLQDAMLVLMQTTVDTFVSRHAAAVDEHTERLEGFSRLVSHELRQPLDTIQSAVALLMREDGTTDEARRRCLSLVASNTSRIATLSATLLTLSGLKTDSIQLQETDIRRLVDDAVAQLADMAGRRGVAIRVHVPPIGLVVDTSRFELVVINLVSNAIKYSDPRKSSRFVDVSAQVTNDRVRLSVEDNGLGIPAHLRDRVFDRFFRAHASQDRALDVDGVGLGLSIVRECASHLGAVVRFDSQDGQGSAFHVELPLDGANTAGGG